MNTTNQKIEDNKPINKIYVAIQESRALFNKAWFLRETEEPNNFKIHLQPSYIGTYELDKLSKVVDVYNIGISDEVKDALVINIIKKSD